MKKKNFSGVVMLVALLLLVLVNTGCGLFDQDETVQSPVVAAAQAAPAEDDYVESGFGQAEEYVQIEEEASMEARFWFAFGQLEALGFSGDQLNSFLAYVGQDSIGHADLVGVTLRVEGLVAGIQYKLELCGCGSPEPRPENGLRIPSGGTTNNNTTLEVVDSTNTDVDIEIGSRSLVINMFNNSRNIFEAPSDLFQPLSARGAQNTSSSNSDITNNYYGKLPKKRKPFYVGLGSYTAEKSGSYGILIEVSDTALLGPKFQVGGGLAGNGVDVLGYSFNARGQYTKALFNTNFVGGVQVNQLATYVARRETITMTQRVDGDEYPQDLRVWNRELGVDADFQLVAGIKIADDLALFASGGITTHDDETRKRPIAPIVGFQVLGQKGNFSLRADVNTSTNGLGAQASIGYNFNSN